MADPTRSGALVSIRTQVRRTPVAPPKGTTSNGSSVEQLDPWAEPKVSSSCCKTLKKLGKIALVILAVLAFVALNVVTFGAVFHVALALTLIHLAVATAATAKIAFVAKIVLGAQAAVIGLAIPKIRKAHYDLRVSYDQAALLKADPAKNSEAREFQKQYFERLVSREFWSYKDIEGMDPQKAIATILGTPQAKLNFLQYLESKEYDGILPHIDLSFFCQGISEPQRTHFALAQLNAFSRSEHGSSVTKMCDLHDDLFLRMILAKTMYTHPISVGQKRHSVGIENTPNNRKILTKELVKRAKKASAYSDDINCSDFQEVKAFITFLTNDKLGVVYLPAILVLVDPLKKEEVLRVVDTQLLKTGVTLASRETTIQKLRDNI